MVAAHNGDLAAARAMRPRHRLCAAADRAWAGQTSDLTPQQDWDVVAPDFVDLADTLGA